MKFALLLTLIISSASVFAANCPEGAVTIKKCKSTPVRGDSEVAAGVLDSVAICQIYGGATVMVSQKGPWTTTDIVTVETRPGGTTYTLNDGEVMTRLSVVTGTRKPVKKARLSVKLFAADVEASSTYTCK